MAAARQRTLEDAIQILHEMAIKLRIKHYVAGIWHTQDYHNEYIFTMMTVVRLRQVAGNQPVYEYDESDHPAYITYQRLRTGRRSNAERRSDDD